MKTKFAQNSRKFCNCSAPIASGRRPSVMVIAWSAMTLVIPEVTCPLLVTLQAVNAYGSIATGVVIKRPPMRFQTPRPR